MHTACMGCKIKELDGLRQFDWRRRYVFTDNYGVRMKKGACGFTRVVSQGT